MRKIKSKDLQKLIYFHGEEVLKDLGEVEIIENGTLSKEELDEFMKNLSRIDLGE